MSADMNDILLFWNTALCCFWYKQMILYIYHRVWIITVSSGKRGLTGSVIDQYSMIRDRLGSIPEPGNLIHAGFVHYLIMVVDAPSKYAYRIEYVIKYRNVAIMDNLLKKNQLL